MDVLSDAIAAMRTGRPHASRPRKRGSWGLRFAPFAGAGFHVVLQGTCWLFPEHGGPIALGVGDVAFLPHGHGHGLADAPTTSLVDAHSTSLVDPRPEETSKGAVPGATPETVLLCGAYLLDKGRPHSLLGELPEVIHLPAQVGGHPSLRGVIDLLGTELAQPRPGSDAIVPGLLDTLLLYILRAFYDDQAHHHSATGWAAALTDPVISAALRCIHDDPARPWTVQELGAQVGLSRAPFARRFTALVGQPPLTYLTWWRMTIAARLLHNSDTPLRAVARQAGYTSEFAFAKAFKREYGINPGAYRRSAFCTHNVIESAPNSRYGYKTRTWGVGSHPFAVAGPGE